MRVFIPRFLGAIGYLVVLTVVGTVGYVAIEGWPWREALYMTAITVTAVGSRKSAHFRSLAGTEPWCFWQAASRESASGRADHLVHRGKVAYL